MTAPDAGARVHDLGAERRAELLVELFRGSSARGHLRNDSTVRGALTPAVLLEHVRGAARIGAMPFVDADHVSWACIDLDVQSWGIAPDDPEAREMVDAIVQAAALCGLRGAPERSRGKGWHVWVFFDRSVPAQDVRALLRAIALESGARDETDLVCPRQDRIEDVGNGTYLPLCGLDRPPFTRFHQWDENGDLLPVEDAELAAFLRDLAEHRSPGDKVPAASAAAERPIGAPGDHPCAWILDELADLGLRLEAAVFLDGGNADRARITFACPLHEAPTKRHRGGSGVFWTDGRGRCSSAKCGKHWRTVAEFVELAGGRKAELRPIEVLSREEFETDEIPESIVEGLLHRGSSANCNGGSKTGKSYFAAQLAMCVATGTPFLGLPARRGIVVYVCLEMTAAMMRRRMEAISSDSCVPMPKIGRDFHLVAPTRGRDVAVTLLSDSDGDRLAELVKRLGAVLLILDTLYKFIPCLDPSDNGEMGPVFARIARLATVTDAATLTLDHVPKGVLGSGIAAHSALGAVVKGGAARTILHLQRTQREDGGRWQIDVDSHFGSWDEPLHYMRPRLTDGSRGAGVVRCTALEGQGLDRDRVRELFRIHGDRDEKGRPRFQSQRALIEAAKAAGLISATSSSAGDEFVTALRRDLAIHFEASPSAQKRARPVWWRQSGTKKTSPHEFVWVAPVEPENGAEDVL